MHSLLRSPKPESRDQVKRRDGGAFDKDRGLGVQVVGLASVAARPLLESPVWVGFYHELSVDFSVSVHARGIHIVRR